MIQCKRAYEPPSLEDGQRILVDRLWPRGCRKDTLALHAWLPDLAPSTALRKAFKGGEIGFATFRQRYRDELAGHPEHWWALLEMAGRGTLTLNPERRAEPRQKRCRRTCLGSLDARDHRPADA